MHKIFVFHFFELKRLTHSNYLFIANVIFRPHQLIPIRQAFNKKSIKTIFTSGSNLKSLLCQCKTKLLPKSYPGVYELKCTCNPTHFSETKKKILTRTIEHQQDSFKGKWDNSGAIEHTLTCHRQLNWIHPKT